MTPNNSLSSSTDSLTNDFRSHYDLIETAADAYQVKQELEITPQYMFEGLTGKPFDQDNINFLEANIHAIFLAIQNNEIYTFKKLFNFLSKDPINQYHLLEFARHIAEDDSEIEICISKLFEEIISENPHIDFSESKWDICRERLGSSLRAFKNAVGIEFHQDKADMADEWVFDVLTAIEDADLHQLEKLLTHAEYGDYQNIWMVLLHAGLMSETLGLDQPEDSLRNKINVVIAEATKKNISREDDIQLRSKFGYCKENDHKLISHLQKVEEEKMRDNTMAKTVMQAQMYLARYLIPDQSHLQPQMLKNITHPQFEK